jgi:hypothetical protein
VNKHLPVPDDDGEGGTMEFNFAPYADFVSEIGLLDAEYFTTVEVVYKTSSGMLTSGPELWRQLLSGAVYRQAGRETGEGRYGEVCCDIHCLLPLASNLPTITANAVTIGLNPLFNRAFLWYMLDEVRWKIPGGRVEWGSVVNLF